MGDCKRFSSAKQAAYYGRIVNRGCHSIRRVIVRRLGVLSVVNMVER
ncbi:hypothetical protein LEP1GSC132_0207 [Leptospira kirschneri str. 200803703]|uniref:Transposase, IS116/IS110/IS902 domain protein n=1 Tax=Leptospira kirschneri str. 200802841 TaxID=1193047 RepID=A0A828YA19_9LEPT|nr:hypothetical protein LEP1GSC131_3151 [Leptospira kirschneri str. 200802841]EMO65679.1 hypothetical protein LEP1GSC132_0207 [Leptospira kirschneri str. 200803703]EMO75965.1 hypothetical protein LEP1GSC127_0607 [Leptospira kirschneri str. 200801925]